MFSPISVKTRLQVQVKSQSTTTKSESNEPTEPHYSSTWDALSKIVTDDGVKGLYSGMAGSLLGVASTNFAYFYWYSVVRTLYLRSAKTFAPPSTLVELSLGAVAGAVAQLCTIPVAVITTRQQTQRKTERKGFVDTAREVVEGEDGVFGLWRGLKASLVLVVNPAITYGAYERLKESFFPGKTNLKPWEAFRMLPIQLTTVTPRVHLRCQTQADSVSLVLGAASKALATITTQPLIVAKVGLQSRPPPERNGKPFGSFVEVMKFIVEREGVLGLFKGIGPQILKGFLVQGILMMTKERYVSIQYSLDQANRRQHGTFICSFLPLSQEPASQAAAENCADCCSGW